MCTQQAFRLIVGFCCFFGLFSNAVGSGLSTASVLSGSVLYLLHDDGHQALKQVSQVSIHAIENTAHGSVIVLRTISTTGSQWLRLSVHASAHMSRRVGDILQVSATATGYVLSKAGEIIAFIPNELGKSLLHHSRHVPVNFVEGGYDEAD